MFDLAGRTALVTGASGAIGGAIARALAGRGARVALSGTRVGALDALAAELEGAVALGARLDDATEVDALVPRAVEALGGLSILVHAGGVTRDGLAARMGDADWQQVLAVNLEAGFRLARAAARPMMKARHGRLVFVSSVVARMGNAGQANYAASKAGLEGLARALAAELAGRGITSNSIAPGFIVSPMTDALTEAQRRPMLERVPAGRFGTPDDIAAAAVWLASDEGAYVTGQTIAINGGMWMG